MSDIRRCKACKKNFRPEKEPHGFCMTCHKAYFCENCCRSHHCMDNRNLVVYEDPSWISKFRQEEAMDSLVKETQEMGLYEVSSS